MTENESVNGMEETAGEVEEEIRFDVAIVGGGLAGLAAAYHLAKAGVEVVVIERGDVPGTKNVMGGVIYENSLREIFGDMIDSAPLERKVIEQRLWVLTDDGGITIGHRNRIFDEKANAHTVLRVKFDAWLAEQVEDAGAVVVPETAVEELIIKNDQVVGVRTGRDEGDIYADCVIVADGCNSLLALKHGFRKEHDQEHLALAVKEVHAIDKGIINDRFGITDEQGVTIEIVGPITGGVLGTGFIYTNKDTISVGMGCLLKGFVEKELNPSEMVEKLKANPLVEPLLRGSEMKEYMAHCIPEGGYFSIPKLYGNGVMFAGDAAQFVNGINREGSNMAMLSGKIAAQTYLKAKEAGDFSAERLKLYESLLRKTFIFADLHKYRNLAKFIEDNPHMLTQYPELAEWAAREWLTVDGVPKRDKQRAIIGRAIKEVGVWRAIKDAYGFWRNFS
jgi:electron transfer flavoprotein-quinone oxidoreductase